MNDLMDSRRTVQADQLTPGGKGFAVTWASDLSSPPHHPYVPTSPLPRSATLRHSNDERAAAGLVPDHGDDREETQNSRHRPSQGPHAVAGFEGVNGGGGGDRRARGLSDSGVGRSHAVSMDLLSGNNEPIGAAATLNRLHMYLPRAVVSGAELHLALGFEVDLDDSYWLHYSTRHDTNRYNQLRREIEKACNFEFNGGGRFPSGHGAPPPTLAFYERPPPARLSSFEVTLSLCDPSGGIQHVLLHTKLGSNRFPSVKNVVQRIHNLIGSKRAAYQVERAKPEVIHDFMRRRKGGGLLLSSLGGVGGGGGGGAGSPNSRNSKRSSAPIGFSSLPGFGGTTGGLSTGQQQHPSFSSSSLPREAAAAATFSGGARPLPTSKRLACELCGLSDYRTIAPVKDRLKPTGGGFAAAAAGSFSSSTTASLAGTAGVRWVGDCCLSRCVRCGWQYIDEANQQGVCLPWDDEWVPAPEGGGMASWGDTRWGTRHYPKQRYSAHVPLDDRQRRRVFVDVVDVLAPAASCFQTNTSSSGEGDSSAPEVELVSETTGEVVPLLLMRPPGIHNNDRGAGGSLLCGDVLLPDVYTVRVNGGGGGTGGGRYVQCNWRAPFELTYLGPMLMTVEVKFDSSLAVVVRDLSGNNLDHAVVTLKALGRKSGGGGGAYTPVRGSSSGGGGSRFRDAGQVYSLGKAPRKCMAVEVPDTFEVTAMLWGHGQLTLTSPFTLDHGSWPPLPPQLNLLGAATGDVTPPPLTLLVQMVRFAVEFRAVDLLGQPLTLEDVKTPNSPPSSPTSKGATANSKTKQQDTDGGGAGWRLTLTEHSPLCVGATGSYVVRDLLSTNRNRRMLTLSGLTDGGDERVKMSSSQRVANGEDDDDDMIAGGGGGSVTKKKKVVDKVWSLDVTCDRFFVSHLMVGEGSNARRVSPHEFNLSPNDWLKPSTNSRRRRGSGDHDDDDDDSSAGDDDDDKEEEEEEGGYSDAASQPLVVNVVLAVYDVVVRLWDADTHTPIPAPRGTSVALVLVAEEFEHEDDGDDDEDQVDQEGDPLARMLEGRRRRVELSTKGPEHPTSFRDEELSALKGTYAVHCSAPGFDTTGLHVGGRKLALPSSGAGGQGGVNDGGDGLLELSTELWEKMSGTPSSMASEQQKQQNQQQQVQEKTGVEYDSANAHAALSAEVIFTADRKQQQSRGSNSSSKKSSTALFVDIELRFNPVPVMWPHQVIQRPRLPPPTPVSSLSSSTMGRRSSLKNSGAAGALSLDLCLVLDVTGSMGPYLTAAASAITSAARELHLHYPGCVVRFGAITFTDMDPDSFNPAAQDSVHAFPFNSDAAKLTRWLDEGGGRHHFNSHAGLGGGDVPEDLLGGLDAAGRQLSWRGTTRVCVVVTDAPCHGSRFHSDDVEDAFPSEPDPRGLSAEGVLGKLRGLKVKLVFGRINSATDVMVAEFQRISQEAASAEAVQAEASEKFGGGAGGVGAAAVASSASTTDGQQQRLWVDEVELPPLGFKEDDDDNGDDDDNDGYGGGDGGGANSRNEGDNESGVLDEKDKEERRLYLRDVMREALFVGSCHMEVLGVVRVSWALPAHHSRGPLKVKEFELQRKRLALPMAPPSAAEARRRRLQEQVREKRRRRRRLARTHSTASSGAGLYGSGVGSGFGKPVEGTQPDDYGTHHLSPASRRGSSSSSKNSNNKNNRFGSFSSGGGVSGVSGDDGDDNSSADDGEGKGVNHADGDEVDGGWASTFVRGVRPEHSLLLPAAVPAAFRVRAHCYDGSVTAFSEQSTVLIGVPGSSLSSADVATTGGGGGNGGVGGGMGDSSVKAVSVSRILVRVGGHVESVVFLFTDGVRNTYSSVAAEEQRRERSQRAVGAAPLLEAHASTTDAVKAQELAIRNEAAVEDSGSVAIQLAASEHVVEVRGVNSDSFCETIEFLTTHGRRKRFQGLKQRVDGKNKNKKKLEAGTTTGFKFRAKPGRRVVGLILKHCYSQQQQEERDDGVSDGFRVVECVYTDIPLLSDEEQKAADDAARTELMRLKAAEDYRRGAGVGGGDDDYEDEDAAEAKGGGDGGGPRHVRELMERSRAAERAAAAANKEYVEALQARAFQDGTVSPSSSNAKGRRNKMSSSSSSHRRNAKTTLPPGFQSLQPPDERLPVGLSLCNNSKSVVRVNWVDTRGKEVSYFHLQPEETKNINSHTGHAWVARVAASDEILYMITLNRDPIQTAYIGGPPSAGSIL